MTNFNQSYRVIPIDKLPDGYWKEVAERNGYVTVSIVVNVGTIGELVPYILGGRRSAQDVAEQGDKLDEQTARILWPALGSYRP